MYILKNITYFISMTGGLHLLGNVYNHPTYDDGTYIHTSRIINYSRVINYENYEYPTENCVVCTTKSGSLYTFNKEDIIDDTLIKNLEVI